MLFIYRWSHDLHQRPQWDTILSPEMTVTIERRNYLVRLDLESGATLWNARVGKPNGWLASTPTALGYLCLQRRLHSIDPITGILQWEQSLGDERAIYGRLVVTDDYFLVGGWRGYTPLHCLAINTGTELWRMPERHDYARAIIGPWGIALHYIEENRLLVMDPETGKLLNRLPLPKGVHSSDHHSSVQRYGAALLAVTRQGDILLLDPGKDHKWRALGFHDAGIFTIQPTILDDWLLFQDTAGRLCLCDLSAGRLLWSKSVAHNHERIPAIRLAQKHLIVGTSGGQLLLFDDRGQRLASRTVGKRITTNLGSAESGTIVFGTTGALTCFDMDGILPSA